MSSFKITEAAKQALLGNICAESPFIREDSQARLEFDQICLVVPPKEGASFSVKLLWEGREMAEVEFDNVSFRLGENIYISGVAGNIPVTIF